MRDMISLTIIIILSINVIQPKKYLINVEEKQNNDRQGVENMSDDIIDDDDDDVTTTKTVERSGEEHGQDYTLSRCDGSLECDRLEVTGADYAKCNGEYSVLWYRRPGAPDRPIYKHTRMPRSVFSALIGRGPIRLCSHWLRAPECCCAINLMP